jgi:hypothetical protein
MTVPLITTGPFAGLPRHHFGAILADPAWRFVSYDKATAVTARGKLVARVIRTEGTVSSA